MFKIFEIGYEKHSNDIFKTSDKVQLSTSFESFSYLISKILDVYLKYWNAHIYLYEI